MFRPRSALIPVLVATAAAACSSSTAPDDSPFPGDPTLATAAVADAPAPPDGTGVSVFCRQGPGTQENNGHSPPSDTCPILHWGDFTYWVFTGASNSSSLTVVAYDGDGNIRHSISRDGARYPWMITVADDTVTIFGQWGSGFDQGRTVTFTYEELQF